MKASKYDKSGSAAGEIELPQELFSEDFSEAVIYEVVEAELNNRRQGTHKTKTISEVKGGGKKPYRQKGTGNARQGSIRATQYRGGGIVFGPLPRDYSFKIPTKKRRVGIRSILCKKAQVGAVAVLQEVGLQDYSTKNVFEIFKNMGILKNACKDKIVIIGDDGDEKFRRSCDNIENLKYISWERILAPEIYHADHVVISESILAKLAERYKKISTRGAA